MTAESPAARLARVVELCEEQKRRGLIGGADWVSAWRAYNEAMHAFIRDDAPALLAEVAELERELQKAADECAKNDICAAGLIGSRDGWRARAEAAEARYKVARRFLSAHMIERNITYHDDVRHAEYLTRVDAAIDAAILAHHGAGTGEGNDPQT